MKKLITTVIILLVIIALPALTGQYLKYTVMHRIDHSKLPSGQQIQVTAYKAGWLHSIAQIKIMGAPGQMSSANDNQVMNINLDITHGPVAITRDMQGKLQWVFGSGLVKGTATTIGNFTMNVLVKVSFFNNINLQFFNHNSQSIWNNFQVNIGDLISHISVAKKFTSINGDVSMQNFQIANPSVKMLFQMSKMDSVFSLMKDSSGLWLGKRSTVVPDFSFSEAGVQLFALQGLNFNLDSQAKDNQVNASLQISINKLMPIHYDAIGPVNFEYHLSGVELSKLEAFSQFVSTQDMSAKNPNAEQLRNEMMLYLIDVLQGSTQSLDNLSVGTSKGMVSLTGKIILPKQAIDLNQPVSKPMLALLISQMSMRSTTSFKLIFPADLLSDIYLKLGKQNQMMSYIKVLQDSGFIVLTNNNYITDFTYNQGQAMVNNQPIADVIKRFQAGMQALSNEKPTTEPQAAPASVPAIK
ncbi:MAG: DUF945 family protein, partial [Gammaproteobacteria bacterium]